VGYDLGHGKNKEARISMWQPRYFNEGKKDLETLDVKAVIDRNDVLNTYDEIRLTSVDIPIIR
jgi:hypothetical protein